jgi:phosphate acetyltransferase
MVFSKPPVEGLEYAVYADCAININPDCDQLAQIAVSSAKSAESLFGLDPRVALLSFSSAGSANHPDADKVICAKALLAEQHPQLKVIGEAQFDTALLPSIRRSKMPDAEFSEPANVYIFPNLDSGNIGHKIAERVGGASVIGPVLQGLNKPLNDLSRGATVDGVINTIALTCLQV